MEGKMAIAIFAFTALMTLVFFYAIALAVRYRKRKRENEELIAERQQVQIEIHEQTLQHISREIHDNLGQVASLIKINLNTMQPTDAATEKQLAQTKDLARDLIRDLKMLSVRMGNDRLVQNGLTAAIQTEADRLNNTGIYRATLHTDGEAATIDNDKALILYRMVQETLNNIVKHSEAGEIDIWVTATAQNIGVKISDNGKGFDMSEAQTKGGAGLHNLHSRAQLLNASLDIKSGEGEGTTVTITLPL